jgi:hypothetical protein
MDMAPISKMFEDLLNAGTVIAVVVTAFFVMLAGFQYISAGGSTRAVESAKASLHHALLGLAVVFFSKVLANIVGNALGATSLAVAAERQHVVAVLLLMCLPSHFALIASNIWIA